ncbi:MAG: LPXTG cell wall anchor domain-containing protein [Bacillota bacterium]
MPKTEIKRKDAPNGGKTPEPNRSSGTRVSPKTGDDNHPEIYAVMALLSAALLLRLALRRKRKG